MVQFNEKLSAEAAEEKTLAWISKFTAKFDEENCNVGWARP